MTTTTNARISGTRIGHERGQRYLAIGVGYGGDQCGSSMRIDAPMLDDTVWAILEAIGRTCWEDIGHAPVRVKMDEKLRVIAIGHYLEDKWFEIPVDK